MITRIRLTNGANVVACNAECAQRYRLMHLPDGPMRVDALQVHAKWDCAQCGWCGRTVVKPVGECLRHGDECPDVDVYMADVSRRAVRVLHNQLGCEMTAVGWSYLRGALELHGTDVKAVVRSMLRLAPEWNTADS
jgi:hypothetical protein